MIQRSSLAPDPRESRRGVLSLTAQTFYGAGRAVAAVCALWLLTGALTESAQAQQLTIEVEEIVDETGEAGGSPVLTFGFGIATDGSDNAYVSGYQSDNVFQISPTNVVSEIMDLSGAGLGASLDGPSAITADAAGNVYVVGEISNNAFEIATDGTVTEIIDSLGDGSGSLLDEPHGIAVDSVGNVFVSSRSTNNVFRITPGGAISLVIDSSGAGPGQSLSAPTKMAVDAGDNVYVVGRNSQNVLKIDPGLNVTQVMGEDGDGLGNSITQVGSIAIGPLGDIYVSCRLMSGLNYVVFVVRTDGSVELTPINNANNHINGLVVDSDGMIIVAETFGVNEYEPDGTGKYPVILPAGDFAGNTLNFGWDVAVDTSGAVYTAGRFSNNAFRSVRAAPEPGFAVSLIAMLPILSYLGRRPDSRSN